MKIDSTILTKKDMQGILAGLRSLDSMNGGGYYTKLMEKLQPGSSDYDVKALFAPEMQWRLVEEYGPDCYTKQADGRLLLAVDYSDKDSLFGWLLSFGDQAELLEPQELRLELEQIIHNMSFLYDGKNGGKINAKTTNQD